MKCREINITYFIVEMSNFLISGCQISSWNDALLFGSLGLLIFFSVLESLVLPMAVFIE